MKGSKGVSKTTMASTEETPRPGKSLPQSRALQGFGKTVLDEEKTPVKAKRKSGGLDEEEEGGRRSQTKKTSSGSFTESPETKKTSACTFDVTSIPLPDGPPPPSIRRPTLVPNPCFDPMAAAEQAVMEGAAQKRMGHAKEESAVPKCLLPPPPRSPFPPRREFPKKRDFDKRTGFEAHPDVGAPGMPVFDTHCHLDRLFLEDKFREAVGWKDPLFITPDPVGFLTTKFPDAFGSNFKGCITNGCDPKSWYHTSVYEKFAKAKGVYLTFGCHPSKAAQFDPLAKKILTEYLKDPTGKFNGRVVAVGECGLDSTYYDTGSPRDLQAQVFRQHLELAKDLRMPLVVHLRGEEEVALQAHSIMKDVLGPFMCKQIGIHMHCFNYSLAVAENFLKDFPRMKFGLVPHFFKEEVAAGIDLAHLITETDAPYFIPGHLRSKFPLGLPGFAYHTAAQMALIRGVHVSKVLEANKDNVMDLYGIDIDSEHPEIDKRRSATATPGSISASGTPDSFQEMTRSYNQTKDHKSKSTEAPLASCSGPIDAPGGHQPRDRNKNVVMTQEMAMAYQEAVGKVPKPKRELVSDAFRLTRAKMPPGNWS